MQKQQVLAVNLLNKVGRGRKIPYTFWLHIVILFLPRFHSYFENKDEHKKEDNYFYREGFCPKAQIIHEHHHNR